MKSGQIGLTNAISGSTYLFEQSVLSRWETGQTKGLKLAQCKHSKHSESRSTCQRKKFKLKNQLSEHLRVYWRSHFNHKDWYVSWSGWIFLKVENTEGSYRNGQPLPGLLGKKDKPLSIVHGEFFPFFFFSFLFYFYTSPGRHHLMWCSTHPVENCYFVAFKYK